MQRGLTYPRVGAPSSAWHGATVVLVRVDPALGPCGAALPPGQRTGRACGYVDSSCGPTHISTGPTTTAAPCSRQQQQKGNRPSSFDLSAPIRGRADAGRYTHPTTQC
jgi:hypothetical protein